MSLIAGRGCRWPPRRDSVSPCAPLSRGGRDTHDGHENSPILVFFSNLLEGVAHRCAEIPTLAVLPHTFCSHLAMHGVPTLLATLGQRRQVTELEVPCVARPGGRFNGDGGESRGHAASHSRASY